MKALFDRQVARLYATHRSRMKRGLPGIEQEVEEFIRLLREETAATDVSSPVRIKQVKALWEKGWGKALGFKSFGEYLVTIPEIPEALMVSDKRFPLLVLVDARLDICKVCELAGLRYKRDGQAFEDSYHVIAEAEQVYWMRAQDGRRNRGKLVSDCVRSFRKSGDEVGLTDMQGAALYVQKPGVTKGHLLDFAGSVPHGRADHCMYLGDAFGGLSLSCTWVGHPRADHGVASRRGICR